jgi:hypothetical protein
MLGDLIYEGNLDTDSRILNTEENKIEYNFTEGRFKDIEIIILGTFWAISVGKM